jgi:polyhydroxyalkanoate synthase
VNKDIEIWKKTMKSYNDTPYKDGITPRQAIWKKNKATLWYYPASKKKYRVPVFIVYSLINQPFILDLLPGGSTIEALVKEGYDVYLIDFGKPGLEDKDMSLNDYITAFIQPGIKKALKHSSAEEMTLMGYCLGGTLAAIYASIAEEPIKNLVLFVTPVDFSDPPFFDKWVSELRKKEVSFEKYINEIGVIPASQVESGIRLITSPVYLSPYLSLLLNANDKDYVEKWDRFNNWTKGHIPLAGNAAIQLAKDLIIDNNLIKD